MFINRDAFRNIGTVDASLKNVHNIKTIVNAK